MPANDKRRYLDTVRNHLQFLPKSKKVYNITNRKRLFTSAISIERLLNSVLMPADLKLLCYNVQCVYLYANKRIIQLVDLAIKFKVNKGKKLKRYRNRDSIGSVDEGMVPNKGN